MNTASMTSSIPLSPYNNSGSQIELGKPLELLEPTHRGLHRFVPRHPDEIEVDIGDPVYVQKEAEDLWCEGNKLAYHSSEIRGLRSTKCSSKTLQNFLYFMYKKTHVGSFFRFSFRATLLFPL